MIFAYENEISHALPLTLGIWDWEVRLFRPNYRHRWLREEDEHPCWPNITDRWHWILSQPQCQKNLREYLRMTHQGFRTSQQIIDAGNFLKTHAFAKFGRFVSMGYGRGVMFPLSKFRSIPLSSYSNSLVEMLLACELPQVNYINELQRKYMEKFVSLALWRHATDELHGFRWSVSQQTFSL